MADSYLYFDDTEETQKERESTVVSTGASEAGDIVGLGPDGKFDPSVVPAPFYITTWFVTTPETVPSGQCYLASLVDVTDVLTVDGKLTVAG